MVKDQNNRRIRLFTSNHWIKQVILLVCLMKWHFLKQEPIQYGVNFSVNTCISAGQTSLFFSDFELGLVAKLLYQEVIYTCSLSL